MNITQAITRIKIIYQDATADHDIQLKWVMEELHKSAYEEAIEDEESTEPESFSERRAESET